MIQFKGKANIRNHHLAIPPHELLPVPESSLLGRAEKPALGGNVIIHGDNLLALKSLVPTHAGKVDVIYIDPPYNTGNEKWVYNDNVDSPMLKDWFGRAVDKEDLTRHDKWCCMMWPRLHLLRELLGDAGMLFVSIDDNELHRARMMLDEIFGEENFRNMIVVRRHDKNISRQFAEKGSVRLTVGVEYILAYSKSEKFLFTPVLREKERTDGYWKGFWNAADRPTMRYDLLGVTPAAGQWKWKRDEAEKAVENYRTYLREHPGMTLEEYWRATGCEKRFIRRRTDLTKGKNRGVEHWIPPSEGMPVSSHWDDLLASKKFGGIEFDSPKNVEVVERLLSLAGRKDAVVLDSFAGSGTTAHAVVSANRKDAGTRRFILVECEPYAHSITAERVRRVLRQESRGESLGFSYFTLGPPLVPKSLLSGKFPSWHALARHVFNIATGEHMSDVEADEEKFFVGRARQYEVYLVYRPDRDFLLGKALTLDDAHNLPAAKGGRRRLVYAPNKFADSDTLGGMNIEFCRIPFEIMQPLVSKDGQ